MVYRVLFKDTEHRKIRLLGGYFSAIKIVIIRSALARAHLVVLSVHFARPIEEQTRFLMRATRYNVYRDLYGRHGAQEDLAIGRILQRN
jgi:hypothetical protein